MSRRCIRPSLLVVIASTLSASASAIDKFYEEVITPSWHAGMNWAPIVVPPGPADNAFLLNDDRAFISQPVNVNNVTLNGGNELFISAGGLFVADRTTINETSGSNTFLQVANTVAINDLDTNYLDTLSGGELRMAGGKAQVDNLLTNNHGCIIRGFGSIEANASSGVGLANSGSIVCEGGNLTLRRSVGASLDLDGASTTGRLFVTDADYDLTIDAPLSDSFEGIAQVGEGNTLRCNQGFTLGNAGLLQLAGGVVGRATLAGNSAVVQGSITVGGEAEITSDVTFTSPEVLVNSGSLYLTGQTTYSSGSFVGSGTIVQEGNAVVSNSTTIEMAAIDLDGSHNSTTWLVTSRLELWSDYLNGPGSDVFHGQMTLQSTVINAGRLEVDNLADQWTMAGTLNLQSSSAGRAVLVGDDIVVTGSLLVQGNGDVAADTIFATGSNVGVLSASLLLLNGQTTFEGGTFAGLGTIAQQNDAVVTGHVAMDTTTFDWDGLTDGGHTFEIAPGASFTINSHLADAYDNFLVVGDGAQLTINAAAPWALDDGVIRLGGSSARIEGADLVTAFGSRIEGSGTIEATVLGGVEVRPGLSAGQLVILGDYLQDVSGGLRMEIGGAALTDYDRVTVQGTADLDGWLDVDLINGFVPQPGDVFVILEYGEVGTQFSYVSSLTFGAGPGEFMQPIFASDHLALYVPLPGDSNYDGLVSGADYTIWADHFGSAGDWAEGDYSGDGVVSGADYTIWADHFGQSVTLDAMAVPVPEPSACCLLLIATAGLGLGRLFRPMKLAR